VQKLHTITAQKNTTVCVEEEQTNKKSAAALRSALYCNIVAVLWYRIMANTIPQITIDMAMFFLHAI
jgi:hypothetical protein